MNEKLSQRRKAQAKTRLLKQLDAEEGCVENVFEDENDEMIVLEPVIEILDKQIENSKSFTRDLENLRNLLVSKVSK